MNTAPATQQINADGQSLILPNKREVLLMKLNEFKVNNLSAREQGKYQEIAQKATDLFYKLCWYKFGVSWKQLHGLEQQDINELAVMVHQQSKITALFHTGILACFPVIGWIVLFVSLRLVESADTLFWPNMRYYWWYKRMKKRYGQDFKPLIKE